MTIQVPTHKETGSADRIIVDPDIRGGVPCIGDSHVPIAHILERLASGANSEGLMQVYPSLTTVDIRLALTAAAWVMRDPAIDWAQFDLQGMVEFQQEMRDWQILGDYKPSTADDSTAE